MRRKSKVYSCAICGTTFQRERNQITCSPECSKINELRRKKQWRSTPSAKAADAKRLRERLSTPEGRKKEHERQRRGRERRKLLIEAGKRALGQ